MNSIVFPLRVSERFVRRLAWLFVAMNIFLGATTWLCLDVFQHPARYPAAWNHYEALSALRELNTQEENCLADWCKSLGHSMPAWAALFCFALDGRLHRDKRSHWLRCGWLLLASVFILMSFDEVASIHERSGSLTSLVPFHHGTQQLGWVYVLTVPIAAFALAMLWFAYARVLTQSRVAFALLAFGIFLYGTKPLHEHYEMKMWAAAGWADNWARPAAFNVLEEGCEMFGGLFAALGIWIYALSTLRMRPSCSEPLTISFPARRVLIWAAVILGGMAAIMFTLERLPLEMNEELGIPKLWFPDILAFLCFAVLARLWVVTKTGRAGYLVSALFNLWLSAFWGAALWGFYNLGHVDFLRHYLYLAMYGATSAAGVFLMLKSRLSAGRLAYLVWALLVYYALRHDRDHSVEIGYFASAVLLVTLIFEAGKAEAAASVPDASRPAL